jgi:AhpD family alkylhydroperoxidase
MGCKAHEFFENYQASFPKIQKMFPEAVQGFSALFSKIMKDGALTLKEKELILVGIAVTIRCESCIRLHIKKAFDAGATSKQIIEAASVAVVMGGGPSTTFLPVVIETIEAIKPSD